MLMINETQLTLGERLKDFRQKTGMTMDTVAEKTSISKGTLSNYENDKTPISVSTLKLLMDSYGTTFADFFDWDMPKNELKVFEKYGLSEDFAIALWLSNHLSNKELDVLPISSVLNDLCSDGSPVALFSSIGHYISSTVDYRYKREYLRLIIDTLDLYADKNFPNPPLR